MESNMQRITGWVCDVYAAADNGLTIWVTDEHGETHQFHDDITPYFFVRGTDEELHEVCKSLKKSAFSVELKRAKRYEVFARRDLVVLQVNVRRVSEFRRVVQSVTETFPRLRYYHTNL